VKLFEIYKNIIISETLTEFDKNLFEETVLTEVDTVNLNQLLSESKLLVFEAFGISPSDAGKYFIAGSARLFKNPMLLKYINEVEKMVKKNNPTLVLGDLDVIIPNKKDWDNLYKNYTNIESDFLKKLSKKINKTPEEIKNVFLKYIDNFDKRIYRPGSGGMNLINSDIEVFDVWKPSNMPGYENVKVRPTEEILKNSVKIGGYYYMNVRDIVDYKWQLGREKEKQILKLIGDEIKDVENIKPKPGEDPKKLERRKYVGSEKLFKNIYTILKNKK
jgi:hypothetical protein